MLRLFESSIYCTLNLCAIFWSCTFQHLGQLCHIQWTQSGPATVVFHWIICCSKCVRHCISFLFGSLGTDRTYDIFINSEAQLPLCYEGMFFGGATETRTQKPAFTDRWISNPLQYHYGTAPLKYLAGGTCVKKFGGPWENRTPT